VLGVTKRRGSVTAQDLAEEKARRLRDDPEYRAAVEKAESERSARAEERQRASQPILEDLRRAGVNVDSLWQLYKQPEAYDRAVPVLLMHLRREHPETLMEMVGDALPNKPAAKWWADLKDIYLTTRSEAVRDRVAAALSGCATRQHYDDLLAFVAHETLGNSRIYFLRPINRIGNRATPGAGRAVIETLASDPVLGVEANAILRGKGRKQ
jgi:hypothetical protein